MRLRSTTAKKNIGLILRERRIRKGLSQSELASEIGITQTFLSLVEHSKRVPSYDVLRRIAEVLGEDAAYLEREARSADLDTVVELNRLVKRLIGTGNRRKLSRLLEFVETLG
jgi:transcriptional regulator with XRE-family HTH domain